MAVQVRLEITDREVSPPLVLRERARERERERVGVYVCVIERKCVCERESE